MFTTRLPRPGTRAGRLHADWKDVQVLAQPMSAQTRPDDDRRIALRRVPTFADRVFRTLAAGSGMLVLVVMGAIIGLSMPSRKPADRAAVIPTRAGIHIEL